MDEHHLDSYKAEQYYIPHYAVLELLTCHGVAAVFYYDYFAVVFFYVGQGVNKNPCPVGVRCFHSFCVLSFLGLCESGAVIAVYLDVIVGQIASPSGGFLAPGA